MHNRSFEWCLAAGLTALFIAFLLWQTPSLWQDPLTPQEVDTIVATLEQQLVQPMDSKTLFISRVRDWALRDDGRAVLLVNLMRYRDRLDHEQSTLTFAGTPLEANDHYERLVAPLALKQGEYPLIGGATQASLPGSGWGCTRSQ